MEVGYARVSTLQQTTDMQTDALRASGCDRIYTEKASEAKADRPQLTAALDYLREGDVLVVWRLDRLARSMKQLIATADDLEKRGIGLKSLTEQIDTTSPTGRLIFHLLGALAEFEHNLLRERVSAGLVAARARGNIGGRPKSMTTEKLAMARAMLRDQSLTVEQVAKQLAG